MSSLSEFDLIEKLFAPLATSPGAFGLKDDVATIAPREGHDLIVTTDTIVEGVDFFATDPPDTIARKSLRVNLSDLAAKGAEPAAYLLTLQLPKTIDQAFLEHFVRGLEQDQELFAVSLLGGDMSATVGPFVVSITAFGYAPTGELVRRSGARIGELVCVTGTIGDSGAGMSLLRNGKSEPSRLIGRYRVPEPRVAFASAVRAASASIDVSDGLLADLGHLAERSGVRITIDASLIPRSPELKALWGDGEEAIVQAATAGDDYEIAFTAPAMIADARTPVSCIGRVEQGSGVALLDTEGREIAVARKGYSHF
ncbi:MAG TPA: thiamine-phosphate kinase [Rhizomicrobium sp.]|jgi:thiamine-monophosphate kinase|nr:thiamine-phosphate kinase [Rhizomicrobium sp.]